MRLEIVPFTSAHLEEAATLLAARHRADRQREPRLPALYENPAETLHIVTEEFDAPGAAGVAALRGGRLAGYLLSRPAPQTAAIFLRPRAVWVAYGGHAVDPEEGAETYRALYAALSPQWLAGGSFAHYVTLPATDREALTAWYSLGFGQEATRALRDTSPVAGAGEKGDLELRPAGPDDRKDVVRLMTELARYHARAPIFAPLLPETLAELHQHVGEIFADEEDVQWLARRNGRTVAVQTFSRPRSAARMITPERCIHLDDAFTEPEEQGSGVGRALLDAAMAWARGTGYDFCTVSWDTPNLLGARFWQGTGFRPVLLRLCRQLDERIAWARG